jgi:hypothetical protein
MIEGAVANSTNILFKNQIVCIKVVIGSRDAFILYPDLNAYPFSAWPRDSTVSVGERNKETFGEKIPS